MAGSAVSTIVVSSRLDNAMVMGIAKRVSELGFWVSVLVVTLVACISAGWQTYQRGDFVGLWLTPDQQGRLAYENLEFQRAFELFLDPAWKGVAAYDSGKYADSVNAFGRIPTAVGFFNRRRCVYEKS